MNTLKWEMRDSGRLPPFEQMILDRAALEAANQTDIFQPRLRFFQYDRVCATYGYITKADKAMAWAEEQGIIDVVQRPTGGGAVVHTLDELSFSFLWPRGQKVLPDRPRDAYAAIHAVAAQALNGLLEDPGFELYVKSQGSCASGPVPQLSVCFEEPVCNDVMFKNRKVVGGALRLTKKAILYQGTMQIKGLGLADKFKKALSAAFL